MTSGIDYIYQDVIAARFNLKQYRVPSAHPVLWNVDIKACIRYQGGFDFGLTGAYLFCVAAKADPQFAIFGSPGKIRGSSNGNFFSGSINSSSHPYRDGDRAGYR